MGYFNHNEIIEIDPSKNEKDESNQAVGIGVGVTFGFLAILLLVLFIVFLLRRKVNFCHFFFF